MPASTTQGLVVKSVQAGKPFKRPRVASSKVPEHCAQINCLAGSSFNLSSMLLSLAISRVYMPLPNSTTSALLANSRGCCASILTPFIEVTVADGQVICIFQPADFIRFNMPAAINESSSLNPSKVRIAMFIISPIVQCLFGYSALPGGACQQASCLSASMAFSASSLCTKI